MYCPFGRYGDIVYETSSSCSGICSDGYKCDVGSVTSTAANCPSGYFCYNGTMVQCGPGTYSVGQATVCAVCPNNTANPFAGAIDSSACVPCAGEDEGAPAGAAECWPGIVSALASDPPPVVPKYGNGDVVTITFTKKTNQPPMAVTFFPSIGVTKSTWINDGMALSVQVHNVYIYISGVLCCCQCVCTWTHTSLY
jgi:hypothetical protein